MAFLRSGFLWPGWLIWYVAVGGMLWVVVSGLRFENDVWLRSDDPIRLELEHLGETFGQGETYLLMVPDKSLVLDPARRPLLERLERDLQALPHVTRTLSPLSARLLLDEDGQLSFQDYATVLASRQLAESDYLEHLSTSPYGERLMATGDADYFLIALELETDRQASRRQAFADALENLLDTTELTAERTAGMVVLRHRINETIQTDFQASLGWALVLVGGFMLVCLRGFRRLFILGNVAVFSGLFPLFLLRCFGLPLTAPGLVLPILATVIAIAHSLHIFALWEQEQKRSLPEQITGASRKNVARWFPRWAPRQRTVLRRVWVPTLITSGTSAFGCASFGLSRLVPLHEFAFIGTASVLFLWGATLWFVLFGLQGLRGVAGTSFPRASFEALRCFKRLRRWRLDIFCALLAAGGVLSLGAAGRFETNFLDAFFAPDSEIYRDFEFYDAHFGGSNQIDLLIKGDQAEAWRQLEAFQSLVVWMEGLRAIPGVRYVDGYPLLVSELHAAFDPASPYPQTAAQLAQELLFLGFSRTDRQPDVLAAFLDFDQREARVRVQTNHMNSRELGGLLERLRAQGDVAGFRPVFTGLGSYFYALSQQVLVTQVVSAALTLSGLFALLVYMFGWRIGALGTFTSFLPVLLVLSGTALASIPFDFATVLVAALALGLGIDDTVHVLHHHKQTGRIYAALRLVAQPIFLTSVLFCLGVLSLSGSELVLLRRFSFSMAAALALCFLASLFLLPALLHRFTMPSSGSAALGGGYPTAPSPKYVLPDTDKARRFGRSTRP